MLESAYQAKLIKKVERLLPGSYILKTDTEFRPGVPDLLVLYKRRWALLEVKKSCDEPFRPNQEWYIERFNELSFSAAIYPENEREVLNALQQSFEPRRTARLSQRQ